MSVHEMSRVLCTQVLQHSQKAIQCLPGKTSQKQGCFLGVTEEIVLLTLNLECLLFLHLLMTDGPSCIATILDVHVER